MSRAPDGCQFVAQNSQGHQLARGEEEMDQVLPLLHFVFRPCAKKVIESPCGMHQMNFSASALFKNPVIYRAVRELVRYGMPF